MRHSRGSPHDGAFTACIGGEKRRPESSQWLTSTSEREQNEQPARRRIRDLQVVGSCFLASCPWPGVGRLTHEHNCAVLLETNFVHQGFHQVDPTPLRKQSILRSGRVGY